MTIEDAIATLQKCRAASDQFAQSNPDNALLRWAAVMRHPDMMVYAAEFAIAFSILSAESATYTSEHAEADLAMAQTIFESVFAEA